MISNRASFIENEPELFAEITNSDFLYQKAPCGFISFLPNGSILRVNETLSDWLGFTEQDIYHLKFNALITKAGHLYYQMVVASILESQGFANEINFTFVSAKGNFDILFNAVAYKNSKGALIAINATIQNITERKKYEAELLRSKIYAEEEKRRFEFLSNSVPNMIWTASPIGEINFINQRMGNYFSQMDLPGMTQLNWILEDDREGFRDTWNGCLKTGRKLEKEVRIQGQKGQPEWFLLIIEPYHNAAGEVELWFGSSTNIHKRKLLQLANYSSLSNSLSEAHQTIDSNKEILSKIALDQSHMIRKPVANIIGLISLLCDEHISKEGKQLLDLLKQSSEELDQLIREVVNNTLSNR